MPFTTISSRSSLVLVPDVALVDTVAGVAERIANRHDFRSSREIEGNDVEIRARFQCVEDLLSRAPEPPNRDRSNFHQGDGAHRQWFAPAGRFGDDSALIPRQPFRLGQPVDQDVSIKQKTRSQSP